MATIEPRAYLAHYKRYYEQVSPLLKTKEAKAYTMFTLSLLALSFFGFFAISPTLTTISELKKKVEDAATVDKNLQSKIMNLTSLQKAYPTIEGDIPIIYDTLPPHGRPANLLGKIKALANRSNITLTGLQVQEVRLTDQKPAPQALPFSFILSGNGTYEGIYNLLDSLYTLDRMITVETFTITKPIAAVENKQLTLSLKGNAYVLFED